MSAQPKVFISHTTHDKRDSALARRLASGLRERGAEVFIAPDVISAGTEWEPHLVQNLMERCTHFLVLLSKASISVEWVLKEIDMARSRFDASGNIEILPLRLGDVGDYRGSDFISRFQDVAYHADPLAQVEEVARVLGLRPRGRHEVKPLYAGKRFWIPYGQALSLPGAGFLPDPESEDGKFWNQKVVPFDSISQTPCLALLGEPGTGKSTALKSLQAELAEHTEGTRFVDLKGCVSENQLYTYLFNSEWFRSWKSSDGCLDLFLDSLDECLLHIDTIVRLLVNELEACARERLRLRIACRTAEWPGLLSQELKRLWGEEWYGAYEIVPLRLRDVGEAAQLNQLDPEVFLKEVQARDAVPLAIKPVTLNLLLSLFKKQGRLPATQHDLYEKGCLRLCEEPSEDRQASGKSGALLPEERLALAERIAAVTMFSKRSFIYLGSDTTRAPDECTTLAELSRGNEWIGGTQRRVESKHIQETLQTGLFTGGTGERLVGWSHWTYAEFLSARYLESCRFTLEEMKSILMRPDRSGALRVIPPLQEVAAWLASLVPGFLEELISLDPQALLRRSAEIGDDRLRAGLVESLLKLLDTGRIVEFGLDLRRKYDVLKHPGLAEQLRPYITDRNRSFYARHAAVEIAEACIESALTDVLLRVAGDESEALQLRRACVRAMGAVGGLPSRKALSPILQTQTDPEKELIAEVLRVLWPEHLSAAQLFEHLTPPQDTRFFGSYFGFLSHEVVKHLKPQELPEALRWVKSKFQSDDSGSLGYFGRLAEGILQAAWENLDAPGVLQEFARVCLERFKRHLHLFKDGYRNDDLGAALLQAKPLERKRLVQELMPHLKPEGPWKLISYGMVLGDDLPWLIEQLEKDSRPGVYECWLRLIEQVFSLERGDHLEAVFVAKERLPLLGRQLARFLDPVVIGSPSAERMREDARVQEESRRRNEAEQHPPIELRVKQALDEFESGDLAAWSRVGQALVRPPSSRSWYPTEDDLNSSLVALRGWQSLDEPLRRRCVAAAERYLREGEPQTQEWLRGNEFHPAAGAGYRALRLLLEQRPQVLAGWSSEEWARWVPLVLDWHWERQEEGEAAQAELVKQAYTRAPDAVLAAVKTWMDARSPTDGFHSLLRRLTACWDARLSAALLDRVRTDTEFSTDGVCDLLQELVPRSLEAVKLALGMLDGDAGDEAARKRRLGVARVLIDEALAVAWPYVWPLCLADPTFGKELLAHSALVRRSATEIATELGEDAIERLFLWLSQHFPEEDSSDRFGEAFKMMVLRNRLISSLQAKGSQAAVAALQRIRETLPDIGWLNAVIVQADEQRLRQEWQGIPPVELFKMAARAGSNHP